MSFQVNLQSLKRIHIIGVCGTLMGAFAAYLKRRGLHVTGSDQNVYPPMSDVLRNAGVELLEGYSADHLEKARPDLVVIGNVISATNPEAKAVKEKGIPFTSLPEFMERLMLVKTRNIVCAGTHGKTTTSSLMTFVLRELGGNPSWFIGGVSEDLPFSFQVSEIDGGQPFVLEGDEYDTAFWDKVPKFFHYLPDDAILTSIEYDHADIYPDLVAVEKAFEGLLSRIRPGGRLIACVEYPSVRKLLSLSRVPVLTYGKLGSGAQYQIGKCKVSHTDRGDFFKYDVFFAAGGAADEEKVGEFEITLPGEYNGLNALAVWIECKELGFSPEKVSQALSRFKGVKRRQEVRGEPRGVLVIDDFAHHPTAVRETLKGLRAKYPERRLIAVFEPRSATSRRKVFQQAYSEAFDEAALVYLAKPYDTSKIPSDQQFSSDELIASLRSRGRDAKLMDSVPEGVVQVALAAQVGDVVAVLSNGGFEGFIPKLMDQLTKSVSR